MDFKFKTCQKIAELTQVINILFVQNHEKDLLLNEFKNLVKQHELEFPFNPESGGLKNNAENERQLIIDELKKCFFVEENKIRSHYELSLNNLKTQIAKTVSDLIKSEKQLSVMRAQCDQLAADKLRCETNLSEKIESLIKENSEMKEKLLISEQNYQNVFKNKTNKEIEYKNKIDKLSNENIKLIKDISQIKENNVSLENKCKELEMGVMSLNDELSKCKLNLQRSMSSLSVAQAQNPIRKESSTNEELAKELMKYKLELKNRDKNFNKIFTRNSMKTVEPFFDYQRLTNNVSDSKNGFNVCLGLSKRPNNNNSNFLEWNLMRMSITEPLTDNSIKKFY